MPKIIYRDIKKRSLKNFLLDYDECMSGSYNAFTDTITVHSGLSEEETKRTLSHELGHARDRKLILSLFPLAILGIILIFSMRLFGPIGMLLGFAILMVITGPAFLILQRRADNSSHAIMQPE